MQTTVRSRGQGRKKEILTRIASSSDSNLLAKSVAASGRDLSARRTFPVNPMLISSAAPSQKLVSAGIVGVLGLELRVWMMLAAAVLAFLRSMQMRTMRMMRTMRTMWMMRTMRTTRTMKVLEALLSRTSQHRLIPRGARGADAEGLTGAEVAVVGGQHRRTRCRCAHGPT